MAQKIIFLKSTIENLEKERDFYFGKLREIEILCQNTETPPAEYIARVTAILYAPDASDAPVSVEEDIPNEASVEPPPVVVTEEEETY